MNEMKIVSIKRVILMYRLVKVFLTNKNEVTSQNLYIQFFISEKFFLYNRLFSLAPWYCLIVLVVIYYIFLNAVKTIRITIRLLFSTHSG